MFFSQGYLRASEARGPVSQGRRKISENRPLPLTLEQTLPMNTVFKAIFLFLLLSHSLYSQAYKEHATNQVSSTTNFCPDKPLFVGIGFKEHAAIEFNTETFEENGWNAIIKKSLQKVLREKLFLISLSDLQEYQNCKCKLAVATLKNYRETYVGGGEREGSIEIVINLFKSPLSKEPFHTYLLRGEGDSDYGHSNPLEYAIEEACKDFEIKELGFRRFRYGFGPAIGYSRVDQLNLYSINFLLGGTYDRHFITIPFSAGLTSKDTTSRDIFRDRTAASLIGAGIDYSYSMYRNTYISLGPSALIGYWLVNKNVVHETRDTNLVYTSGVSGPGFYNVDSTQWVEKNYFFSPGFEIWGGIKKINAKFEGRVFFGINSSPMLLVRLGVLFMKR